MIASLLKANQAPNRILIQKTLIHKVFVVGAAYKSRPFLACAYAQAGACSQAQATLMPYYTLPCKAPNQGIATLSKQSY